LSLDISFVLIATYIASLIFQFRTHERLFAPEKSSEAAAEIHHDEIWSIARSLLTLLGAAAARDWQQTGGTRGCRLPMRW